MAGLREFIKGRLQKKIDVTVAPFECINMCICHLYWNTVYFIFYKFKTEEEAKLQLMYMEDYI